MFCSTKHLRVALQSWQAECNGFTKIRLAALLLLFAVCIAFPSSALALSNSSGNSDALPMKKTVTVAYFQYGNYMSLDEDGKPIGFAIDYLDEIARYANWDYEYLLCRSAPEAFEAVETGKADILPAIHYTEDRQSQVLFSTNPICQTNTIIYTASHETRCTYEDFEFFDEMKVGALAESCDAEVFKKYSEENGFESDIILYPSLADLMVALETGRLDAITTVNLGGNIDYRIVAQFDTKPLYLVFPTDRPEILSSVNMAMANMILYDPEYSAKLYKKYFSINTSQDPVFTAEEYQYMETAPVLSVVYDSSRAPFAYTDPLTGEFSGAVSNLFESITEATGLEFEYIAVDNHADGIDMVEQGEADIIYTVDPNIEDSSLLLTPSYLSAPMAKVAGTSKTEKTVAYPTGYWAADTFILDRQDRDFITFQTPQRCLEAVLQGEADVAYLDLNAAIYYHLSNESYESLHITALANYTNDMHIGVSSHIDPRVASILGRCVQFTSSDEVSRWVTENSLENTPLSFTNFLKQHPLESIAAIVLVSLGVISGILYVAWSKIKSNRAISKMAYTDALTGGWSLYRFQAEVSELLKADRQTDYAILSFDFCRFKSFNAVFGFAEGDRLLIGTSKLLADFSTEKERYARVAADEYVVLMQWEGRERFLERFHALDQQINKLDAVKSHAYKILITGGVYFVEPSDIDKLEATVSEMIDCARYARESIAGHVSKSTAALYNTEMKERDIAERNLLNEAEDALKNGEFVAYYQPKVEIASNRIVGFEALVRWISPSDGIRHPASFIPLFEQSGFIVDLDLHIFELACKRIRSNLDRGIAMAPISCNFSRHHLRKNDLPAKLKAIIDKHQVAPEHLELELTENLVFEDFDRALEVCGHLKALGFPISIDDFGSGYSSLGTLQNLPIDTVKLDKSFLMNGEIGVREQIILEGIVRIAHRLEIEVVTEGVELQSQAAMLASLDVGGTGSSLGIIAQGLLYSCPVGLEESDRQMQAVYLKPSA